MNTNSLPTNPVAFAQYVWENIETEDTLVDKLGNLWEVTSYTIFDGRKIAVGLCCVDNEGLTNHKGDLKKLTRCDLASKYYVYVNNTAVSILPVENWNVITFVQNYNTLWSILDTMNPPTKEEREDIYAMFYLTQKVDKEYEERNKKLSTLKTLDGLKSEFKDYDGDKIREKVENCLPKEDKKMDKNEKNYFPKNKGKTGVDSPLKSAFYSFNERCPRVTDTFYDGFYKATEFSKTLYDEFKKWLEENHKDDEVKVKDSEPETKTAKVDDSKPVTTIDNTDEVNSHNVSNTDSKDNLKLFPNLDKYFNHTPNVEDDDDVDVNIDFVNRPFHLGDIVILKNGYTGYISLISHSETFAYYYIPVYPILSSTGNTKFKSVFGLETKLNPTLEDYIRVGDWCLESDAARTKLRKYEEFKDLAPHYTTDEKDSNTSTTNDETPSPNNSNSFPKYLKRLNLTDSAYNYEVNTMLSTDTACKLNDVIKSLNDIIWCLQELEHKYERKRQLEER